MHTFGCFHFPLWRGCLSDLNFLLEEGVYAGLSRPSATGSKRPAMFLRSSRTESRRVEGFFFARVRVLRRRAQPRAQDDKHEILAKKASLHQPDISPNRTLELSIYPMRANGDSRAG